MKTRPRTRCTLLLRKISEQRCCSERSRPLRCFDELHMHVFCLMNYICMCFVRDPKCARIRAQRCCWVRFGDSWDQWHDCVTFFSEVCSCSRGAQGTESGSVRDREPAHARTQHIHTNTLTHKYRGPE